jgi:hypothetical protein
MHISNGRIHADGRLGISKTIVTINFIQKRIGDKVGLLERAAERESTSSVKKPASSH